MASLTDFQCDVSFVQQAKLARRLFTDEQVLSAMIVRSNIREYPELSPMPLETKEEWIERYRCFYGGLKRGERELGMTRDKFVDMVRLCGTEGDKTSCIAFEAGLLYDKVKGIYQVRQDEIDYYVNMAKCVGEDGFVSLLRQCEKYWPDVFSGASDLIQRFNESFKIKALSMFKRLFDELAVLCLEGEEEFLRNPDVTILWDDLEFAWLYDEDLKPEIVCHPEICVDPELKEINEPGANQYVYVASLGQAEMAVDLGDFGIATDKKLLGRRLKRWRSVKIGSREFRYTRDGLREEKEPEQQSPLPPLGGVVVRVPKIIVDFYKLTGTSPLVESFFNSKRLGKGFLWLEKRGVVPARRPRDITPRRPIPLGPTVGHERGIDNKWLAVAAKYMAMRRGFDAKQFFSDCVDDPGDVVDGYDRYIAGGSFGKENTPRKNLSKKLRAGADVFEAIDNVIADKGLRSEQHAGLWMVHELAAMYANFALDREDDSWVVRARSN